MSHKKLRAHRTSLDNLISNLRGEVGEVIFTWILLRNFMVTSMQSRSGDMQKDLKDPQLAISNALVSKLSDEIVGRLSELAEFKIGRLNFHFASVKLNALSNEVDTFKKYIRAHGFHTKRNYDIAHKELPEQWDQHRYRHIRYPIVVKAVALALRLMKKIDSIFLGPSSRFLWREMRKRRYPPIYPAHSLYMVLPEFAVSGQNRIHIVLEEDADGRKVWEDIDTTLNGKPVRLKACKKWAVVAIGNQLIALDNYPLQKIDKIEIQPFQNKVDSPEDNNKNSKDL